MKAIVSTTILLALVVAGGPVYASDGYVMNSGKSIVRTGTGGCLRTKNWSKDMAVVECDPDLVASREAPVEMAAMEVVIQKELKPITLQADALFAFDSAELTENGRAELDKAMRQVPDKANLQDSKIIITGYTDRLGEADYNQQLSENRANAVKDYLVSKGVRGEIIDARGLGATNPVVSCDQERGASLIDCLAPNRRTSIEFSAMEVLQVERQVPANR